MESGLFKAVVHAAWALMLLVGYVGLLMVSVFMVSVVAILLWRAFWQFMRILGA